MSPRSSSSTPQARRKSAKSRLASAGKFSIRACIAGSKRSRYLELEREAFGERAREHARRFETLHAHEHALDAFSRSAEPLGDLGDRADEVSRFVQGVDQRCADQALDRVGEEDRGLTLKMVAKGDRLGDIGFEVGGFAGVAADAESCPGVGAQAVGGGGFERRGGAVGVESVVDLGAEVGGEAAGVGLASASLAQSPGSAGASATSAAPAPSSGSGRWSSRSSAR